MGRHVVRDVGVRDHARRLRLRGGGSRGGRDRRPRAPSSRGPRITIRGSSRRPPLPSHRASAQQPGDRRRGRRGGRGGRRGGPDLGRLRDRGAVHRRRLALHPDRERPDAAARPYPPGAVGGQRRPQRDGQPRLPRGLDPRRGSARHDLDSGRLRRRRDRGARRDGIGPSDAARSPPRLRGRRRSGRCRPSDDRGISRTRIRPAAAVDRCLPDAARLRRGGGRRPDRDHRARAARAGRVERRIPERLLGDRCAGRRSRRWRFWSAAASSSRAW